MPKDRTTGNDLEEKVLKPSLSIATNNHKDLAHPIVTIASNKNEYVLVELDKQGNEVVGSDFAVGEVNYHMSFANNPKFKVKKNPQ